MPMSAKRRIREQIRATGEAACFAASNSCHGFHSYYSDCFDDPSIGRVFVIKGGPGTGKSRFMRDVSQYAEESGWHAQMIYCSSDADSLDGVILRRDGKSMAFLDGTAPHVYEPRSPGVREELINLGAFWDASRLRQRGEEIRRLHESKMMGYRMAYRYLSAYGSVYQNRREKVLPFVRQNALSEYAKKLMQHVPNGERFESHTTLMRSVGMGGVVRFDTFVSEAERLYLIEDHKGSSEYLMGKLYRLASEKQLRVQVSRDPILPEIIDGLFCVDSGTAFVVWNGELPEHPHHRISMRRFLKNAELRSIRETVNFDTRMLEALLDETMAQMQNVRQAHFELENIYASAMDFSEKEIYTKNFCIRLFDLQNS